MASTRHGEDGGVKLSQDDSTPNGGGRGVESWQDESTPNTNGGGVELSGDDLTPREVRGPEGVETLGAPTAPGSRQGEDGHGRGEGMKNHPPPDPPGSSRPMAETAWRQGTRRRWRMQRRRQIRKSEPAERGARKHTPPAQVRPLWWEAQSPQGPHGTRRRATNALGTRQHKP